MDNWQASTLSWSLSKKSRFDSCRRQYFYHRFWGQDASLRWRLFEMRNLTTLAMLRGQVVHSVIAEALKSAKLGITTDAQAAKRRVTDVIRQRYMESAKRLWHVDNRPEGRKASDITSLIEHYYKYPNINERAREAQLAAWKCVENLFDSQVWRDLSTSEPASWIEIDEDLFQHFDLDGIQVYARIDFAHAKPAPTIIDWKTGAASGQDRVQLALYSLYAQRKWDWDPPRTRLTAVYLYPDLCVEVFSPTAEEIEAAKQTAKDSFNQMMELEPAFGPADIECFPMTEDLRACSWCGFKGVCEGAKREF